MSKGTGVPKGSKEEGGRRTIGVVLNKPPFSWLLDQNSEEQEELNARVPRVVAHHTYLEECSSTPVSSPPVP